MNKLALTYLTLGVVVIGAIAFVTITNKPTTSTQLIGTETNNEASVIMAGGKVSMKDLIVGGKAQQCLISSSNEFSQSSGVVYVANGKVRGDFDSLSQGVQVQSHMIVDGDYSYIWTSESNQGFKTKIDASTTNSASQTNQQGIDYNQQMDYACSPWSADASFFVLPKGIIFTDLAEMMQNLPESI
ncbi:MAG: hypothetical protein AAB706_03105 [Patescibacteria group bacterium]